jgi:hypothetical protein
LRVNDKHQAATAGATVRVGVIESLTRQSLAARTADRAIALIDPWVDTLNMPKRQFTPPSEAKTAAKLFVFSAKVALSAIGGADLAVKLSERALAPAIERVPRWIVHAISLLLVQASVPVMALGIHYGYITSFWKLLASFAAHLL